MEDEIHANEMNNHLVEELQKQVQSLLKQQVEATGEMTFADVKGLQEKNMQLMKRVEELERERNEEKKRNDIEIDFIISNNSKTKYKMFPIEVKSSSNYSVTSLTKFKEKYKSRIGCCYIIHPRNLTMKEDILCIPPYMTI